MLYNFTTLNTSVAVTTVPSMSVMVISHPARLDQDSNHGIPLSMIGVRCAVPMALMVRTARTTAVTALMVSVMLSPENASVTQAFMEPSKL